MFSIFNAMIRTATRLDSDVHDHHRPFRPHGWHQRMPVSPPDARRAIKDRDCNLD